MPRQFLIQTAIHVSFWIRWAPRVSLPAMSRSKPLCKSKCGRRVKQSLLLFAAIWTINWSIYSTTENIYNRRFRCRKAHKNIPLGGTRAMRCVALCCSDVKYVVNVLLFATIWTTDWTDWTVGFVKILARGVPFVGQARKQILLLFVKTWRYGVSVFARPPRIFKTDDYAPERRTQTFP